MKPLRVTIWNEFIHEKQRTNGASKLYPNGIHEHLKQALAADDLEIRTAWQKQDKEHGLSKKLLKNTDVLLWWGHCGHEKVRDEIVDRVVERVQEGMGFIPLHSSHMAKPFRRLMGTPCTLRWRNIDERCVLWNVNPNHPITQGLPLHFELQQEEMYGEVFAIPVPDELIFLTWFAGGNVFRGGCTFTRGLGKIFYFQPGHETHPTYHDENVLKVIANAIRWAAPAEARDLAPNQKMKPLVTVK